MAMSRINEGGMLEITADASARTAGDVVKYGGDTMGIVADTAAANADYRAFVTGCFELAKNTGLTFTAGEDVYWNATASELTTVQTTGTRIGVVARKATTTASKARILLNQPNAQLAPQT